MQCLCDDSLNHILFLLSCDDSIKLKLTNRYFESLITCCGTRYKSLFGCIAHMPDTSRVVEILNMYAKIKTVYSIHFDS